MERLFFILALILFWNVDNMSQIQALVFAINLFLVFALAYQLGERDLKEEAKKNVINQPNYKKKKISNYRVAFRGSEIIHEKNLTKFNKNPSHNRI